MSRPEKAARRCQHDQASKLPSLQASKPSEEVFHCDGSIREYYNILTISWPICCSVCCSVCCSICCSISCPQSALSDVSRLLHSIPRLPGPVPCHPFRDQMLPPNARPRLPPGSPQSTCVRQGLRVCCNTCSIAVCAVRGACKEGRHRRCITNIAPKFVIRHQLQPCNDPTGRTPPLALPEIMDRPGSCRHSLLQRCSIIPAAPVGLLANVEPIVRAFWLPWFSGHARRRNWESYHSYHLHGEGQRRLGSTFPSLTSRPAGLL